MKTNKIITLFLTTALAVGCHESLEYTDVVFFTGTEDSPVTNIYVDGPSSMGITVTSSCKMKQDVSVSIAIDPQSVEAYNNEFGTAYQMLPANSFRLSANQTTINEGMSVSSTISFDILKMDDFEEGVLYCVPLKITDNSVGMSILAASQIQYVIVNQIITTKCPDMLGAYYFSMPSMIGDPNLNGLDACTMECRVYATWFPAASANPGIQSIIGVEENFLLRFGDISCDKNQMQLAGGGASVTSIAHFNTYQWYHVAVVDTGSELTLYINGEKDQSTESAGRGVINLGDSYMDGFHIGRSETGRYINGCVSEARVWNRALTPVELKNNQCYVSPLAEGLIAYWRLDQPESDGITIKDLTGHGYDAVSSRASITWFENIKCPATL